MTRIALQAMFATKILAAPGAYPSLEKRALLHRSVLERCDGLDGAKDGMIYKVDQCMAVFDPATARSEEHTSELQSQMRISYDVFSVKKKITQQTEQHKNAL